MFDLVHKLSTCIVFELPILSDTSLLMIAGALFDIMMFVMYVLDALVSFVLLITWLIGK